MTKKTIEKPEAKEKTETPDEHKGHEFFIHFRGQFGGIRLKDDGSGQAVFNLKWDQVKQLMGAADHIRRIGDGRAPEVVIEIQNTQASLPLGELKEPGEGEPVDAEVPADGDEKNPFL